MRRFLGPVLIVVVSAAVLVIGRAQTPAPAADPAGVAAYRDNIKALAAINHPWYGFARDVADGKVTPYASIGQWHAIAYAATGEQRYADAALAKILPKITGEPSDANYVREYFAEYGVWYWLLRPGMTADQDAAYRRGLDRWAEWSCGINTAPYVGGFRLSDSDQTVGQYFGCILAQKATGTDWAGNKLLVAAREAVRSFCAKAAGGEWIESGEYNLGTVRLLLLGAYAAGIDDYPEVKALVPQFAEQFTWTVTPDRAQLVQWGDEEKPRDSQRYQTIPYLATFAGLTGRYDLQQTMDALAVGVPVQTQIYLGWRAMYFYRPVPAPVVSYMRFAEGTGHVRYRRDGVEFAAHFPTDLGVDHAVTYAGGYQLYGRGEWGLIEDLGYGSVAVSALAKNAPLFAGLSKMSVRAKPAATETPTGFVATGGTSGPYYAAGTYYNPPPQFLTGYTRRLTYTHPGRVELVDTFDGVHPGTLPNFSRYATADRAMIDVAPGLWAVLQHAPVAPTQTGPNAYTWQTPGGQTVTVSATGPGLQSRVVDEKAAWQGMRQFVESEKRFRIEFYTNEPKAEIRTTIEVK